ncbi:hypothetical protein EDWATA_03392 [Edwardsiella tarda ATCC 23685]|uniref:Uncharacterized protein n=1 Tax=Edwardsiella tarda ATCC 23685 TaxID=500638 RepID=D4F9D4_EDWTA|nr:hypothetical protein EDWATA_03392 [Edwardsiella tarda ATCC 23685]
MDETNAGHRAERHSVRCSRIARSLHARCCARRGADVEDNANL